MSNIAHFDINKGELIGYHGPDVEVLDIPEGVTTIGRYFLQRKKCKKIVFPATVKKIATDAMSGYYCAPDLREVEFLGDVEEIGDYNFDQEGIVKLTFHGKVGKIGKECFRRLNITELNFPQGVESIGTGSFDQCKQLVEVHAPGLKRIHTYAFGCCGKLKVLDIPDTTTIEDHAFTRCRALKQNGATVIGGVLTELDPGTPVPEGVHTINAQALFGTVNIPSGVHSIHEQDWGVKLVFSPDYFISDQKLSGAGLMAALEEKKLSTAEAAAIYLFQSGKRFEERARYFLDSHPAESVAEMMALLTTMGKAKHYLRAVEFVLDFAQSVSDTAIRQLYDLGITKKHKKEAALLEPLLSAAAPAADDITAPWRGIYNEHLMDKTLRGLPLRGLDAVLLADGSGVAPAYLVKCAIYPYLEQYAGRPKQIGSYTYDYVKVNVAADADRAAALLDRETLLALFHPDKFVDYPQLLLPYGRYATGTQVANLLSLMRQWADWYSYSSSGRSAIIVARGGLMLNDTREAMMYMDKCQRLIEYARLRGVDVDTLRDTRMMDFGLDDKGRITFDLGSTVVEATVGADLTIHLYDTTAQKVVKSLPKRNADPVRYEQASARLSDLKKNLKKAVKVRNNMLFDHFLDGRTRAAAAWTASYTGNPVLRRIASLIVWAQGQNTFTLTDEGMVDCHGNPYAVNDAPIAVAHPVEMTPESVAAWQEYFLRHGLKQPFEQVWEPVVDWSTVKSDRYADCRIPYYRFVGQAKRGITVEDYDFHNEIYITIEGFHAMVERLDWERHHIDMNHCFEIKSFLPGRQTRLSNHLIAYFDRCTVYERILKNDVTIVTFLPSFTAAQIAEFIKAATENGCTDVTAVLLEYQQAHFADLDPMAEFTLD